MLALFSITVNIYKEEYLVLVAEDGFVIPAQAGIHDYRALKRLSDQWTPACAGVTRFGNRNYLFSAWLQNRTWKFRFFR